MNQHGNTYSVKVLSKVFDHILIFFLFGIAVTMIAGAGATFEESYKIPTWLGALIMTLAIYITLLLDFNKIVRALGIVTPFLMVLVDYVAFNCIKLVFH